MNALTLRQAASLITPDSDSGAAVLDDGREVYFWSGSSEPDEDGCYVARVTVEWEDGSRSLQHFHVAITPRDLVAA